jgi:hypothetical protein
MRRSWILFLPAIAGCAGAPIAEPGLPPPNGVQLLIIEGAALQKVQEPRQAGFTGLTHRQTEVKARITAHVATVTVIQQYLNPHDRAVDAEYSFPLPDDAAVRDFVLQIGERKIRGIIRERDEARRIHREARRQGLVTTLLTRERSNTFTQSVANIGPGQRIDVRITYLHGLRYASGMFEYTFPRVATDLALEVDLDPGAEVADVTSNHPIRVEGTKVTLAGKAEGEFVLRYRVQGRAAAARSNGYFVLIIYPEVADLRIDYGTLGATEVFPRELPAVTPGRPLMLSGKCGTGPAKVRVIAGTTETEIDVRETGGDALATVWAQTKLSSLASAEEIRKLALQYGLMSEWTAFVTVDSMTERKR